jgi:hypothetical protein
VAGDTAAFTQSFTTPSAGVGKTLAPAGTVTDGNGGLNYDVTLVSVATGEISPASLTITADNKSRYQGAANPVLTASYAGFVNGETPAVLDTPVSLNTTAVVASPAGDYPITASGAAAGNYSIIYVGGLMTVMAAPQLTGVERQGDQFVFTFPTVVGEQYQVEATDGLVPSSWTPVGEPVDGTGESVTVKYDITGPQRFFRLAVTPAQGK